MSILLKKSRSKRIKIWRVPVFFGGFQLEPCFSITIHFEKTAVSSRGGCYLGEKLILAYVFERFLER